MALLSNENICLRALEPGDVDLLYHWENDCNIWHVSDTLSPFSKDILKKYIAQSHQDIWQNQQLRLIIDRLDTEKSIGCIDLFDIDALNRRAGIGILIVDDEDKQHGFASSAVKLLMRYCFEHLFLHQLFCTVEADNTASIRLFENAGFRKTGMREQWKKVKNGYRDECFYQYIVS